MEILAFGIAKDIFGNKTLAIEFKEGMAISELKRQLEASYPKLARLASYMVAVNDEYAQDDRILSPDDEIAIIPPVSGG